MSLANRNKIKPFKTGDIVWAPRPKSKPGKTEDEAFDFARVIVIEEDGFVSFKSLVSRQPGKAAPELVTRVDERIYKVKAGEEPFEKSVNDLVSLSPPNLGNILSTLRRRSTEHEMPYTFVGPVLVSVNPCRPVKNMTGETGPHPYRIAEAAVKQMKFAKMTNQPLNQSIIVSGESGAGKTEASKRVLTRLVEKSIGTTKSAKGLDKRLIDTNPILEAFGNATTLRNRNSSRFGKFMKLNIELKSNGITGASVETYLLERSRVSGFILGECNYHVFYLLLGGMDKTLKKKLNLKYKAKDYAYLVPLRSGGNRDPDANDPISRPDERDEAGFTELCEALDVIDVKKDVQQSIFQVLASILHMGNISIQGAKQDSANLQTSDKAIVSAADFLGVTVDDFIRVSSEKSRKVAGEIIQSKLSVEDTRKAIDAIAKQTYSHLFDWIVGQININLTAGKKKADAFIGVLDIFGFETFVYNDLEQLLINYTNEALHGIFLQKVFDAELTMYKQEGLLPKDDTSISVPENEKCLELLSGSVKPKKLGILDVIVDEGKNPNGSDSKMNKELQKHFGSNKEYFPRPHPKDIDFLFKVKHFAETVSYHIGNFLQKNHDRLPEEVESLFLESKNSLVKDLWVQGTNSATDKKKPKHSSIVSKFKTQIEALSNTLNDSQCSFIRCVKPNNFLKRGDDTKWFEPIYVNKQLSCLGIEPTVQVLSKGMPNRISYAEIMDAYKSKLPKKSIQIWKKYYGNDKRVFVSALFYAFDISPSMYKLGFAMVFFKSGDLEALEKVLEAGADAGKKKMEEIGKKFKYQIIRSKWRFAIVKVLAIRHFRIRFKKLQAIKQKKQEDAAVKIQSLLRMRKEFTKFKEDLAEHRKKIEDERIRLEKEKAEAERKLEEDRIAMEKEKKRLEEEEKERLKRVKEERKKLEEDMHNKEQLAAFNKQNEETEMYYNLVLEMEALKEQEANLEEEVGEQEVLLEEAEEKETEIKEELKIVDNELDAITKHVTKTEQERDDQELSDFELGIRMMQYMMGTLAEEGEEVLEERKQAEDMKRKESARNLKKQKKAITKLLTETANSKDRINRVKKKKDDALKSVKEKKQAVKEKMAQLTTVSEAQKKNFRALNNIGENKLARRKEGAKKGVKLAKNKIKLSKFKPNSQRNLRERRGKSFGIKKMGSKAITDVKRAMDSRLTQKKMVEAKTHFAVEHFQALKKTRSARMAKWNKRRFMFDRNKKKLTYRKTDRSTIKKHITFTKDFSIKQTKEGKYPNVLVISSPKQSQDFTIACDNETSAFRIFTLINDMLIELRSGKVKKLKEFGSYRANNLNGASMFDLGLVASDESQFRKAENEKVMADMVLKGILTQGEMDKLIMDEVDIIADSGEEEEGQNIIVCCEFCGTNSLMSEMKCTECGKGLMLSISPLDVL